jgi:nucleotide-binding universal stress UspA family protein
LYKRVLVPLDGSQVAEIALAYAAEFAKKLGSEVILLNVRAPHEDPDNPEHRAYMSKMAAETEQNISKSPDLPAGKKVKVDSAIIGSSLHPAEEIVDYADKKNISLIIMATHGRTGIRRWTLGSTADKVARVSRCPLLLIRAGADIPESVRLGNLLVTLDGSQKSEAVLPYVEALAGKFKVKVNLLNVVEPPYHLYFYPGALGYYGNPGITRVPYTEGEIKPLQEVADKYLKTISDELIKRGIETSYEVRTGSAGEEIINAEEEMHPDILVMSTSGHSGFGRWNDGSVADKALHAGITPLLLIRPRE